MSEVNDVFERLQAKQQELEKMRRAIAELQSLEDDQVRGVGVCGGRRARMFCLATTTSPAPSPT